MIFFFIKTEKKQNFEEKTKGKLRFYFTCHFQKKRENKTQNASLNNHDISFD